VTALAQPAAPPVPSFSALPGPPPNLTPLPQTVTSTSLSLSLVQPSLISRLQPQQESIFTKHHFGQDLFV
jgi:hypothetical protein